MGICFFLWFQKFGLGFLCIGLSIDLKFTNSNDVCCKRIMHWLVHVKIKEKVRESLKL